MMDNGTDSFDETAYEEDVDWPLKLTHLVMVCYAVAVVCYAVLRTPFWFKAIVHTVLIGTYVCVQKSARWCALCCWSDNLISGMANLTDCSRDPEHSMVCLPPIITFWRSWKPYIACCLAMNAIKLTAIWFDSAQSSPVRTADDRPTPQDAPTTARVPTANVPVAKAAVQAAAPPQKVVYENNFKQLVAEHISAAAPPTVSAPPPQDPCERISINQNGTGNYATSTGDGDVVQYMTYGAGPEQTSASLAVVRAKLKKAYDARGVPPLTGCA